MYLLINILTALLASTLDFNLKSTRHEMINQRFMSFLLLLAYSLNTRFVVEIGIFI